MKQVLVIIWMCCVSLVARADKPSWDVSLVIDQSCSMASNDPDGFALIAPAIMVDMSDDKDAVWLYPQSGNPGDAFKLSGGDRPGFKDQLAGVLMASDSNWFPAFSEGSSRMLASNPQTDHRIMVQVYDGDVGAPIGGVLGRQVQSLMNRGTDGFVIGVGRVGSPGYDFDGSRSAVFDMYGAKHALQVPMGDGKALLKAFGSIFGYLLNSKPQVGQAPPTNIAVAIADNVSEAWVVVLADTPVSGLKQTGSGPGANSVKVEADTGWTHPVTQRSYQVIHLVGPKAGQWTFTANTSSSSVDWLVLETFEYGELVVNPPKCTSGVDCRITVKVTGPPLPEDVTPKISLPDGTEVPLKKRPDGTYETDVSFKTPGLQQVRVIAENESFRKEKLIPVDVVNADGHFKCENFTGQVVEAGSTLHVNASRAPLNEPLDEAWLVVEEGQRKAMRQLSKSSYTGQIPLPSRIGPITVGIISKFGGTVSECRAKFILKPKVHLAVAPVDRVEVGPSALGAIWNPFSTCVPSDIALEKSRDPEQRCIECGGCTGALLPLDLSGTTVTPAGKITAELVLDTPLSAGVAVYLGQGYPNESRLQTGVARSVVIDPTRLSVPIAICAQRCPAGGDLDLKFALSIPDVFDAKTSGPTTVRTDFTVPIRVVPSSFWTCHGWWVLLSIGAIIFIVVMWGFIYPLKFGKTSNFPTYIWVANFGRMESLTQGQTQRKLSKRVARTWYRPNQRIWVDMQGNLRTKAQGAAIRIELRREDGRNRAWIVPTAGQSLMHAPYRPGLDSAGQDWQFDDIIGAEGAPLDLEHVYVSLSGTEPPTPHPAAWCLMLKQV